jgi:hypothetical protein
MVDPEYKVMPRAMQAAARVFRPILDQERKRKSIAPAETRQGGAALSDMCRAHSDNGIFLSIIAAAMERCFQVSGRTMRWLTR